MLFRSGGLKGVPKDPRMVDVYIPARSGVDAGRVRDESAVTSALQGGRNTQRHHDINASMHEYYELDERRRSQPTSTTVIFTRRVEDSSSKRLA